MNKSSYDPFNDEKLHITVNDTQSHSIDDRAPFNDVIKYGDIVQGSQTPKRLEHLPRWFQNPRRIFAAISGLIFASVLIFQIIQIVIALLTGK
jgi:hypothetical protein